ncbi:hypothetical protein DFH09DRAFT_1186324, partial [Mycena vulgaris]
MEPRFMGARRKAVLLALVQCANPFQAEIKSPTATPKGWHVCGLGGLSAFYLIIWNPLADRRIRMTRTQKLWRLIRADLANLWERIDGPRMCSPVLEDLALWV